MKCHRCPESADYDRDRLPVHAVEAGHPLCVVCNRSLRPYEPRTCDGCVQRTRDTLADIADLYAELPGNLDRAPTREHPGGQPLVMLSWGSEGAFWSDGQHAATAGNDNWPSDPPSVAYALARWEDDWRSSRGEPAPERPSESKRRPASRIDRVMRDAVHYEQRHLQWAANNHAAFDEYAADLRKLRRTLEQATTRHDRPEYGAPCFDCGEPLERGWEDPTVCRHTRPDLRLLWARDVTEDDWTEAFGDPAYNASTAQITARGWCGCDDRRAPHVHETVVERDARIAAWESEHMETKPGQRDGCQQGGRGDVWECRRCGRAYGDDEYRLALRAKLEASVT